MKNAGKDTMILNPKEMTGIVDIRSLGYYKNKARHTTAKPKQVLLI